MEVRSRDVVAAGVLTVVLVALVVILVLSSIRH